jgi:hypothetical protein
MSSQSSSSSTKQEELYGGAIVITVPSCFTNVSEIRQVPDNQEVFVDDNSGASLIIELMEHVQAPDTEACAFHFNELARMNKAKSHQIMEMAPPNQSNNNNRDNENKNDDQQNFSRPVFEQMMMGKQRVAKFNEEGRENDVAIFLGLRRLPPPVATDILVTISYAFNIDEHSSDNKKWEQKLNPNDIKNMGADILQSLQIRDYGLFVQGEEQEQDDE